MNIFISYGHDEHTELVRRIKCDLEASGHKVWLDEEKIMVHHDWEIAIEKAVDGSEWVVAFLSPYSVRRPDGVCLDELSFARFRGKKIAPVMVQFVQPPLSISRIQWLDMQGWKDVVSGNIREEWYNTKFAQLLRVLNNEYQLDFEGGSARLMSILKPFSNDIEISRHVMGFYGREWIFNAYDSWLTGNFSSRVFWVKGSAGVGKTAIAAMLAHTKPSVAGIHFCKYNDSDRGDPRKALCSLAYYLSTQLPEYQQKLADVIEIETLDSKDVSALFYYLLVEPLHHIDPPKSRMVLIIDALDEAIRNGRNDLVTVIAREFEKLPPWLGLFITSRPDQEISRKFSRLNPYEIESTDSRNHRDIRRYLYQWADKQRLEGKREKITEILITKSEGVFLYLHEILRDISTGRVSIDNLDNLPQGLTGIYSDFAERHFPDLQQYKLKQRPLLELLATCYEPLAIDIASAVLRWDDYDRDEALVGTESLFPLHEDYLEPFHKSIIDWLIAPNKSGPYRVSIKKGHERFADYFSANPKANPTVQQYRDHFGPYHYLACNRIAELVDVLKTSSPLFASTLSILMFSQLQSDDGNLNNEQLLEILAILVETEDDRTTQVVFDFTLLLLDYSYFNAAETVRNLILKQSSLNWLLLFIDLKIARMTGHPRKVAQLGQELLIIESLPKELLGILNYYLAEGLREQGDYQKAIFHYKQALELLDREQEVFNCLQASAALGDLEYVAGDLEKARITLNEALELAENNELLQMQGGITRILGQIEQIQDNFILAEELFASSLEIAQRIRRPYSIIEAYNSLAESQKCTKPSIALDNLNQARRLALEHNARLELGKGYYIEADIQNLLGDYEKAEHAAMEAQHILNDVGYASGYARACLALGQSFLIQKKYDQAVEQALTASRFYQKEEIYPSYRLMAFHLIKQCFEHLHYPLSDNLEEVKNIPNINNFDNLHQFLLLCSSED
jgi:tetratricopeptide (TPR) repeat protein